MTNVTTVGINHTTASVDLRERVAIEPSRLHSALSSAAATFGLSEVVILSTCNRTEVTAHTRDTLRLTPKGVAAWFAMFFESVSIEEVLPHLYIHQETDAVKHAFRVASGLDSLIVGEPQILGQIKSAFTEASNCGTVGPTLNRLYQSAFSVAKRVRTETEIGQCPVSIAYAAVSLAKHIFTDVSATNILLIGAGEMIELTAKHLANQKPKSMVIANRTLSSARRLADQFNAESRTLREIPSILHAADIVVSCTGSPLPILGQGMVGSAVKQRKQRSMMIVDMAVPRDVELGVNEIPNVYLYSVDDLADVIHENVENRRVAATKAEELVKLTAQEFTASQRSLEVVDTIKAFRSHVEALQVQTQIKASRWLAAGQPAEEVVKQITQDLAKKFMHHPTVTIRQAGADQDQALIDAVHALFNLDAEYSKRPSDH